MKILIGYDGSPSADGALADLAKAGLPPIDVQACVLVAIAPILSPQPNGPDSESLAWYPGASEARAVLISKAEADARDSGRKARDFLKDLFPGWNVKTEVGYDVPAHALLSKADAWKPNLIVLGSRGLTRLGKMLMGSTAEKVLHHAGCAVRIGRPPKAGRAAPLRILIGVDASRDSDAALAEVTGREWPKKTEARLVAVMDFRLNLDEVFTALDKAGSRKGALGGQWPWMKRKLEQAAAKLAKKGVKTSIAILPGEPRRVLLEEAKAMPADCIFLGSKGLSGLQRFLVGSVSSAVAAHAGCSVEVIRPPRKREVRKRR